MLSAALVPPLTPGKIADSDAFYTQALKTLQDELRYMEAVDYGVPPPA